MKIVRSMILLLLAGMIMMGACGCMNHQGYAEEILEKLESKYDRDFEIVKLSYEVDGEHGNYYRAVCKEPERENTFVVYYYLNGFDYLLPDVVGDIMGISKEEPSLSDSYPNVLLNLKIEEYFTDNVPGVLFAMSDAGVSGYKLTIDDVEKGIEHCLSNRDFDAQSTLYLFLSDSIENKEQFESDLVQKILSMDVYKQSISVAYIADEYIEAAKAEYYDDTYRIEGRLREDICVTRYSYYLAYRGQGIISKRNVKGE